MVDVTAKGRRRLGRDARARAAVGGLGMDVAVAAVLRIEQEDVCRDPDHAVLWHASGRDVDRPEPLVRTVRCGTGAVCQVDPAIDLEDPVLGVAPHRDDHPGDRPARRPPVGDGRGETRDVIGHREGRVILLLAVGRLGDEQAVDAHGRAACRSGGEGSGGAPLRRRRSGRSCDGSGGSERAAHQHRAEHVAGQRGGSHRG